MNTPIVRLFALVLVLFAALVYGTTRWTVFEAEDLRANDLNKRDVIQELRIRRGTIRAADGTVLARSVPAGADTFERRYTDAARDLAHVIGYSDVSLGRAGVEETRNDELLGRGGELASVLDQLRGDVEEGNDVTLTIDRRGQRAALGALQGRRGSVVAIEPSTGRIKVMVSVPGYDPSELRNPRRFRELGRRNDSPLLNRATQGTYPPGSTFKVVTAAAALDSGEFTPQSQVDGRNNKPISGVPLQNSGGKDFGTIDLTRALTFSVNTVWAEVAERLGKETMGRYMRRFGFYAEPPIDYPGEQTIPSGEYRNGRLLGPNSRFIDVGRMGIGQDLLQVTPLQMAMVAATVANGGRLMKPRLTRRIVDRDGRTQDNVEPDRQARVVSAETATQLGEMMENVVREGTGTQSALEGIKVGGKTGTAEIDPATDLNQPWFIAFAPADGPDVAIAVTVERSQGGQGGTVAAPIAKQVLQELLR